ncbi:hypothetical protein Tco_1398686 [Tanacetum coccineum]
MIPPQTTTTPLTTPLPTPPITSEALTITTTVHDPLPAVIQRLSNLEKKFESWTKFDHSEAIEASVQANLINEVKNQLLKFLPKTLSDFFNRRLESTIRNVLQKTPALLAQSFSTPEETVYEVVDIDQPLNHENDIDNADDQPDAEVAPKTDKSTWFKQPPRPPTPDPEWNKGKAVEVGPK